MRRNRVSRFFASGARRGGPLGVAWLKAALTLLSLLLALPAQADFRKALEAYQNRDGDKLLAEVRDAVEKKNDDGLMLFLNAMAWDSFTSDYEEVTYDVKSTLKAILSKPQFDELGELLVQATNNSTVDAQYYLLTASQFSRELEYVKFISLKSSASLPNSGLKNITGAIPKLSNQDYSELSEKIIAEYVKRGSRMAMLQSTLVNRAEAGDPYSQLSLGLKYLNAGKDIDNGAHYGCTYLSKEPICQTKDITRGYYWLKRAAKSYEVSVHADSDLFSSQMCELLHTTANGDLKKLKQAYLWGVMGMNERANASSWTCLRDMRKSGALGLVAPQVETVWNDRKKFNELIYRSELTELPDWIVEIREKLVEELPMFTFCYQGCLEVYEDGRVFYGSIDGLNNDLLTKVAPETVRAFQDEFKKIGFYQWTMADSSAGFCPDFNSCETDDMPISFRKGTKVRRFFFRLLDEKSNTLDWKYTDRKRMAIINVLVNKYFPTQNLRCELGNSKQKRQKCLVEFATRWIAIAKKKKDN